MPMVVMPALPGTARLIFLLHKQLTINALINYLQKNQCSERGRGESCSEHQYFAIIFRTRYDTIYYSKKD